MGEITEVKPKKLGRPTDYNDVLVDKLLVLVSEGKSMRTIAATEGMPDVTTMFDWLRKYSDFAQRYAHAKEEAADTFVEELIELTDMANVDNMIDIQKRKLQVDTRKWIASKLKPKRYGEKLDLAISQQTEVLIYKPEQRVKAIDMEQEPDKD